MDQLKGCPDVVGLIGYGSDYGPDAYAVGDCDLFVVLKEKPETVESLHFYICDVPVDLNLTMLEGIRCLEADDAFHIAALLKGGIRHNRSGNVTRELQALRAPAWNAARDSKQTRDGVHRAWT